MEIGVGSWGVCLISIENWSRELKSLSYIDLFYYRNYVEPLNVYRCAWFGLRGFLGCLGGFYSWYCSTMTGGILPAYWNYYLYVEI